MRTRAGTSEPLEHLRVVQGHLVDTEIGGKPVTAAFDSCADVNIMDVRLFYQLQDKLDATGVPLRSFPLRIQPFSPHSLGESVLGVLIQTPVLIQGAVFHVDFVVVPCSHDVLLGMPFHVDHVCRAEHQINWYALSLLPRDEHLRTPGGAVIMAPTSTRVRLLNREGVVVEEQHHVGEQFA